jgi:solute carrier family 25 carnitine/acylcarnitine transporter 20/29
VFENTKNLNLQPLHQQGGELSGLKSCVVQIVRANGFRALWQGLTATVIRNVPANALFFPVFELLKREQASLLGVGGEQLGLGSKLAAGAGAGLCYWMGTYPLDVVKARAMSADYDRRLSWLAAGRQVVGGRGGYWELTRGMAPCALRAMCACASMFATVDFVKDALLLNVFFDAR